MNIIIFLLAILLPGSLEASKPYSSLKRVEAPPLERKALGEVIKQTTALLPTKDGVERFQLENTLAQVYALAYATGENTVPVRTHQGISRPDVMAWLREFTGESSSELPINIKLPVTPERQAHLLKAKEIFLRQSVEHPSPSLGLGWVYLQQGEKALAKEIFRKYYQLIRKESRHSLLDSPSTVSRLPIPIGTKTIKLAATAKPILSQPVFVTLIMQLTTDPRTEKGLGKTLNWSVEREKYRANPTDANLRELKLRIAKDLPNASDKAEFTNGPFIETKSRKEIEDEISAYHLAHVNGAKQLSINLTRAFQANSVESCDENFGAAEFSEGSIPLRAVCVTRLAWKTKNWGLCRDAFSKRRSSDSEFDLCVNYLAYRSKSEPLCKEIKLYLSKAGSNNFDESECLSYAKNNISDYRKNLNLSPAPSFYSAGDWDAKALKPSLGLLVVHVRSNPQGELELAELTLKDLKWNLKEGEFRGSIFNYLRSEAAKTEVVDLTLENEANKVLLGVKLNVPMMPTDASFGPPPADFSIADALGKATTGTHLYVHTLDPKADAAELETVRKELWIGRERAKTHKWIYDLLRRQELE